MHREDLARYPTPGYWACSFRHDCGSKEAWRCGAKSSFRTGTSSPRLSDLARAVVRQHCSEPSLTPHRSHRFMSHTASEQSANRFMNPGDSVAAKTNESARTVSKQPATAVQRTWMLFRDGAYMGPGQVLYPDSPGYTEAAVAARSSSGAGFREWKIEPRSNP